MTQIKMRRSGSSSNKAYELFDGAACHSCSMDKDVLFRGVAYPYMEILIPCQSSTQIGKTGQISVVMETMSVRVTLR